MYITPWLRLNNEVTNGRRAGRWVPLPERPHRNGSTTKPTTNGNRAPRLVVGPLTQAEVEAGTGKWRARLQRALNVCVASIGILVALPLMVVIAILIKLTSRGPVLFVQPRVGVDRRRDNPDVPVDPRREVDHGGRVFRIYKFRTMEAGTEGEERQIWASPDDPRVTRLGRFLRQCRWDELPQLFNVLKGDMNIVGPRPEQPEIFKRLRDRIDGYPRRQRVLPGITGLAQVNQHYDRCVEDVRRKVEMDLEYVDRQSPTEDLRIMLQTFPVILFRKGSW